MAGVQLWINQEKKFQIGPVVAKILKVTTRWQMRVWKIFNLDFTSFTKSIDLVYVEIHVIGGKKS